MTNSSDRSQAHTEQRQRAIGVAAETMGELVEFWGFKASMGRIWTTLYLSPGPLSADEIADRTHLSSGAVSMTLSELSQWGLVHRVPTPNQRKRFYTADTNLWALIRRIFRERELRLVGRAVDQFTHAVTLLEELRDADPDDEETRFVLRRLQSLLDLARVGYGLIEKLADVGAFSLLPIRGRLNPFQKTR